MNSFHSRQRVKFYDVLFYATCACSVHSIYTFWSIQQLIKTNTQKNNNQSGNARYSEPASIDDLKDKTLLHINGSYVDIASQRASGRTVWKCWLHWKFKLALRCLLSPAFYLSIRECSPSFYPSVYLQEWCDHLFDQITSCKRIHRVNRWAKGVRKREQIFV